MCGRTCGLYHGDVGRGTRRHLRARRRRRQVGCASVALPPAASPPWPQHRPSRSGTHESQSRRASHQIWSSVNGRCPCKRSPASEARFLSCEKAMYVSVGNRVLLHIHGKALAQ